MTSTAARLILVSNRLPVTASFARGEFELSPSAGGLATGLKGPHERSGGVWIGWPGETPRLAEHRRARVEDDLARLGMRPVFLTRAEVRRYYEDFSNGAVWPVFHDMIAELPLEIEGWDEYQRVNERFAKVVLESVRDGDIIWVHDYHLMLLPGLLRKALPRARIGFFLHIPFPPSEIFRTLPGRECLLRGLLGADLIGFHADQYRANFLEAVKSVLGLRARGSRLVYDDRVLWAGAFPMGIDAQAWEERTRDLQVTAHVRELLGDLGETTLLLGIDRLDYTKGLLRRILAVERLLKSDPTLAGRIRYVQVAVPSREGLEAYAGLLRRVNELVGRVNSTYGTDRSVPIHLLHRSLSEEEVTALYCAASVMLVTPLRDGMNLVAKEYVACRTREDGVLVLSEFAGAAAELSDCIQVNPYDAESLSRGIRQALDMRQEEQRTRMRRMRARVKKHDIHEWVRTFLERLTA